jgi:hypothetical protein
LVFLYELKFEVVEDNRFAWYFGWSGVWGIGH